jgi:hypothetical protein
LRTIVSAAVYDPEYWLHPAVPLICPSSKRAVIVVPVMGKRTSPSLSAMKLVSVQMRPSRLELVGVEVGVNVGKGVGVGVVFVGGVAAGVGVDTGGCSSMHPANIKTATIATMAIKPVMSFFFICSLLLYAEPLPCHTRINAGAPVSGILFFSYLLTFLAH